MRDDRYLYEVLEGLQMSLKGFKVIMHGNPSFICYMTYISVPNIYKYIKYINV
jgi:hypothetical protein